MTRVGIRKKKKVSKRSQKLKQKWAKSKVGRPEKPKKVGDRIKFKLLNGHWVNGTVRGVQKNYYVVSRQTKRGTYLYHVTKGSILSALGRGIKVFGSKLKKGLKKGVLLAKAGAKAYREERQKGFLKY